MSLAEDADEWQIAQRKWEGRKMLKRCSRNHKIKTTGEILYLYKEKKLKDSKILSKLHEIPYLVFPCLFSNLTLQF